MGEEQKGGDMGRKEAGRGGLGGGRGEEEEKEEHKNKKTVK